MAGHRISLLLRDTRSAFGLTQSEMALRLGVTRGTYQHYESGSRDASLSFLDRFFHEFGVDPILAFFDNGDELIDVRNIGIARAYKQAENFIKERAKQLGKRLSDDKLAYISERLMQELLKIEFERDGLGLETIKHFDDLVLMAA